MQNKDGNVNIVRMDARQWLPKEKEGRPSMLKAHPAYEKLLSELRKNPRMKPFEVLGFEAPLEEWEKIGSRAGIKGIMANVRRSLKSEVRRMRRDKSLEGVAKDYQVKVFRKGGVFCAGIANIPETPVRGN